MKQFSFLSRETLSECRHCGAAPIIQDFRSHQSLSLDVSKAQMDEIKEQSRGQPSVARWVDRKLGPSRKRCGKCRSPDGRIRKREINGDLPPRLVVLPGELLLDSISQPASNNVRFKYPKEYIKIYDGLFASGAIIEGIPVSPGKRDDKVPASWSNGPAILFYERVNQAALSSATESLKAGLDIALSLESRGASMANFGNAADVIAQEPSRLATEDRTAQGNRAGSHDGSHGHGEKANRSSQVDRSPPPPNLPQYDGGNDEYPASAREDTDASATSQNDKLASFLPSTNPPSLPHIPRRSARISKSRAAGPETRRQRTKGILKASSPITSKKPAVNIPLKGNGGGGRET
ncbi:MAG: hypothetical protein Q9203_007227, partial [Teloschistes exilis]